MFHSRRDKRERRAAIRSRAIRFAALFVIFCFVCQPVFARDDGRFADSPLHDWFGGLASQKGLCCSFADGVKIENPDWDMQGSLANDGSGYRVRLGGRWIEVPKSALVVEKNKTDSAYVWPYQDASGATQIRCFIPGAQG